MMQRFFAEEMRKFADRKHLKKKVRLEFRQDQDRPRIYCDSPAVTARFLAHIRQKPARRFDAQNVLLRGQDRNHPGMVPKLFRRKDGRCSNECLLKAENEFEHKIVEKFPSNARFKRPALAALLQHYGYNTSWLDLVDNLWTATWFASRPPAVSDRQVTAGRNSNSGWIYFLASTNAVKIIDLRVAHHGLSLRPHTQAGWSMQGLGISIDDLDQFVIACVEFPLNERWMLNGYMHSAGFFLPPPDIDDTLERFQKAGTDSVAIDVEKSCGLSQGTLGRLDCPRSL